MSIHDGDPLQDTGLILSIHRPQNNQEWTAWHARRDRARTNIHDRCPDAETLIEILGLDSAAEADLITRMG